MALPTAEQVRPIVLRQVSGTVADPLLDTLIAMADGVAARLCIYPASDDSTVPTMDEADYTLYPLPSRRDPRALELQIRPVSVVVDVGIDDAGDWTYSTDPAADVVLVASGRLLLPPTSTFAWSTIERANRVTVTAGQDVSATPDLVLAYGLLASYWLLQPTPGLQSATIGGQIGTWAEARIPAAVRELLAPFRLFERESQGYVA